MLGWLTKVLDRLTAGLVRRGQGLVSAEDRIREERRTAVRTVRDAVAEAMSAAEDDREHGKAAAQNAAIAAANRAGAVVPEVADDEARRLVLDWTGRFDAIQKGWRVPHSRISSEAPLEPEGYPEPQWSELRAAQRAALDRLGAVLRELMEPKK